MRISHKRGVRQALLSLAGAVVTTAPCGGSEDWRAPSLPGGWALSWAFDHTVFRPESDRALRNTFCLSNKQTRHRSDHEKCEPAAQKSSPPIRSRSFGPTWSSGLKNWTTNFGLP